MPMRYSPAFRTLMIQKMTDHEGPSLTLLTEEIGVSLSSLYRWVSEADKVELPLPAGSIGPGGDIAKERVGHGRDRLVPGHICRTHRLIAAFAVSCSHQHHPWVAYSVVLFVLAWVNAQDGLVESESLGKPAELSRAVLKEFVQPLDW